MIFEGDFYLSASLSRVAELLGDVTRLPKCIPNVISHRTLSENKVSVQFRVDVSGAGIDYISSMASRLDITVVKEGPRSIRYEGQGKIAGAGYSVVIGLRLEESGEKTYISWRAEVELGKALSLLGKFMDVEKMAKEIAGQTVSRLAQCVEEGRQ